MKIYIATSFKNTHAITYAVAHCLHRGHQVVSRWCALSLAGAGDMREGNWREEQALDSAERDLEDMEHADAMLVIADPHKGTGHHVEFGYALGRMLPCVLVTNQPFVVFHALVPRVATIKEGVSLLEKIDRDLKRHPSAV